MPPKLALLAAAAFVLFAFNRERKLGIVSSTSLLWPTIWYLVVASRLPGIWLHLWGIPVPGGSDPTDGSVIDRFFFAALTVIGISILFRRQFDWGATLRRNPWLTVFFVYMAISIVWSQFPYVSFKRYVKILGSVTMAFVVLTDERPLDAMLTVLRRCLLIHLPMSIVCIRYFREIGVSFDWSGAAESWQGISTSKNTLGQIAMLGVLYFFWELKRHWRERGWRNLDAVYLLMALYLLKGSEDSVSLTSIAVTVFSFVVFLRIQSLRNRTDAARRFVRTVFVATIALISLVLVHSVVMFSPDSIFGHIITAFGRDITLTDRTNIWRDVYAAASGNPLLGVGIGGFWIGRVANIPWNSEMTWVLGQAHSGYVDTYLQLGIVGGTLFAAVIFSTLPKLLDSMNADFDYACFRITLFITILFVNITESTHLRGDHQLWFLTQIVLWIVPNATRSTAMSIEPNPLGDSTFV